MFDVTARSDLPAAPEWRRLQRVSYGPTLQFEYEHVVAWLRNLRGAWKPLVLEVRDGTRLRGIVPLMVREYKRRGILPYRRIRFLGSDKTDFSAVLADRGQTSPVMEAALDWLFRGGVSWESLHLEDLVEGHPAADAAKMWFARRGIPVEASEGRYYYVDLMRPFAAVMRDTSRRFVRKNVNLARNRITRAGDWRMRFDPEWDADRIVEEAARLHRARQAVLGRPSFFGNAPERRFIREVVGHQMRAGRFRSCWLERGGRPIAYMLGFEVDGVYYAWNMAFDPDEAYFYPSRLLLHELLRECHARALKEFSFMRGEADYKSKWTPHFRRNHGLQVRNRTAYNYAVSLLESAFRRVAAPR